MPTATKKDNGKVEQLITGDIWAQVNKLCKKSEKKTACIAYVTSENLELSEGDILICDASDYEIKFGSTTAKTLETYFKKGVIIYSNPALHAKLLVSNSFLVIGSANLSNRSANNLIETAVITNNDSLISQAKAFCYSLIEEKESVLLTGSHIDRLLKIKVVRRSFKPIPKSNVRKKQLGDTYWYLLLFEMTKKEYARVKEKMEEFENQVASEIGLEKQDVNSAFFKRKTTFSSNVKIGDQIMINWQNKEKTRRYIYPFATVLGIKRTGKETKLVYENTGDEDRLSFRKFQSYTKQLVLIKPFNLTRGKEILKEDATTLKKNWKS